MDPRRKSDENHERLRRSKVPFVETRREIVLELQPLGPPLEREIIIVRIDKSHLKANLLMLTLLLVVTGAIVSMILLGLI